MDGVGQQAGLLVLLRTLGRVTAWMGRGRVPMAMVMVSEALGWLQCFRHRADDAEGICTADMTPTGDVRYRLGVLAGESLAMPVSEYLPFCEMSSS